MGSNSPSGADDPIVQTLLRLRRPLTRQNWLALAFPDGVPEDWRSQVDLPPQIPDVD